MREAEPFPRGAAAEQETAHGGGLAYAGCGHRRGYVGHRVVDCEAGGDRAAGRVDVEGDGLFGGVGFEKEELRYYARGGVFVNGPVEADDSFLSREVNLREGEILWGGGGWGTIRRREKMSS